MVNMPQRNIGGNRNSTGSFDMGLENASLTLQEKLQQQEQARYNVAIANATRLNNFSKQQQEQIAKYSLSISQEVNEYQLKLAADYYKKTGKYIEDDAEAQKKLADDVIAYGNSLKEKEAADDYKRRLELESSIKMAHMQATTEMHEADIQIIKNEAQTRLANLKTEQENARKNSKDKSKNLKTYIKESRDALKQEAKIKADEVKQLREQGVSEKEIWEQTGRFSAEGLKETVFSKETVDAVANQFLNGLKAMFENTISTYGEYQSKINTRLQGSGKQWNKTISGIGIESTLKNIIGVNPYVKLQEVMENVVKATEAGIAYNIEQRAFLNTVSENIANTFDAFDANLLQLIRVQQVDTTAARLGMEADLTQLFNNLYEDTSYLNNSFDTTSQNLIDAISQMSATQGVEFEYTVQKWLGALSSVGFSSSAVNKISQALGYLGSGNVSALSSDEDMQNLIVLAASRAGLSYSDMLTEGLDASTTNKLLASMVDYLKEIANSDNKVVKSQYAQIFGMSVSDLKAVNNLSSTIATLQKTTLSYSDAMNELYSQMGQLPSRVSTAGKLNNLFDNAKYSMATSIASNPATYALWEVTSMIEDLTGGINLPTTSIMGNMVDLNTTVTNLMRAGIVGVSSLGTIGSIISGLGSTLDPGSMLLKLGINSSANTRVSQRGTGLSRRVRNLQQQSSSLLIGNNSGEDYYDTTLTKANQEIEDKTVKMKQNSSDKTLNDIYDYLITVFDPKFTEVEKLMALAQGYTTSSSATTFASTDAANKASKVIVSYKDTEGNERVNTASLISNINDQLIKAVEYLANIDRKTLDISMGGTAGLQS